jgi:hypothetical protein
MRIEDTNPWSTVNYSGTNTPEKRFTYDVQRSKDQMVNAPYYKPQNVYGTGGTDPVATVAWMAPGGVSVYATESDRDQGDPGTGISNLSPAGQGSSAEDPEEPPEEKGFDWMGMIMMMMLLGGGIGGAGMLGGLFGGKDDDQVSSNQEGGVTINIGGSSDGEDWI